MNPLGRPASPDRAAVKRQRRAFRPLIIYLVFALPVLAWDIHVKLVKKTFLSATVTLEGRRLEEPFQVQINGQPHALNRPVSPGFKTIRFSSRDTEVWEINRFVWYGQNPLGDVTLLRSRGDLRVAVQPKPLEVIVTGALAKLTSSEAEPVFRGLPVGDYRVRMRFQHFERELTVRVERSIMATVADKFAVGFLHLEIEPAGGRYELRSVPSGNLRLSGELPAMLTNLPPLNYQLELTRGDYPKSRTFFLSGGQTNQVREVFEYGQANITTEPSGATVMMGERIVGKTPLLLKELKPDSQTIQAALEGYLPVRWTVDIQTNLTVMLATNLVSLRYSEAMDRANAALNNYPRDYRLALTNLTTALTVIPGDPAATRLRQETQYQLHIKDGRSALSAGQIPAATKSVEAALALKPAGTEAVGLRADIQGAERDAEDRRQREVEQKATEVRRLAAMEKAAAQQKAEQEQRRLEAEKAAAEAKNVEEQRKLAMEKDAARAKAEEEQRRITAEKQAANQRREQMLAETFAKALEKTPPGQRVTWRTSVTQSEAASALTRAIGQLPQRWNVLTKTDGDGLEQYSLVGIGLPGATQRALVQCAQLSEFTEVRVAFWSQEIKGLLGITFRYDGAVAEKLRGVEPLFREKWQKELGKPLQ